MILLIGCGNPLRRDDGIGPLLVRRMGRRQLPDVELLACHQLTPDLAPRLAAAEVAAAIFADALCCAPGELSTDPRLLPLHQAAFGSPLGHHLTPAALLFLAEHLYGRRPPAWLLTIPATDFGFGEKMSRSAQRALRLAEQQLCELIDDLAPSPGPFTPDEEGDVET